MKLLVFAHTPPPHHGQSYMVQLMLEGLGGDCRKRRRPQAATTGASESAQEPRRIECYHVNCRLSRKLQDIGDIRVWKFLLLLFYCFEAIWCRYRYGISHFYYVPAPGKRSALYRDWLVMFVCRPFFKTVTLHWHAAGLPKWLENSTSLRWRAITYRLLGQTDLSLVLSRYNRAEAEKLKPKRLVVVPNGIPDACPDFASAVLPRRRARRQARQKLLAGETLTAADLEKTGGSPERFEVLYMTHCSREKGLFDTLAAVALANQELAGRRLPVRLHLTVAGEFVSPAEREAFFKAIQSPGLCLGPAPGSETAAHPVGAVAAGSASAVTYKGFVFGEEKRRLLTECDCFCFPTYYYAESFGLVLAEAMAFGAGVVATRWRSTPELLPRDYPGLVEIRAPDQVANALILLMGRDDAELLREEFVARFTLERHLADLTAALHLLESEGREPCRKPAAARAGA